MLGLAVVASALLGAAPAVALEDGWAFGAGGVVATIPSLEAGAVGYGASLNARYGVSDLLNVNLGALYSYHPPAPIGPDEAEADLHLIIPHLGVVYALDIITVVPYVRLEASLYLADDVFFQEPGRTAGAGLLAGLGFDYRRWREASIGAEVGYHAFLSDLESYPAYVHLSLHVNYHYEPF